MMKAIITKQNVTSRPPAVRPAWVHWLERSLLAAGIGLLAVFAVAQIDGWVSSRAAIRQFEQERNETTPGGTERNGGLPGRDDIDFSLWAPKRIQAFVDSLQLYKEPAMGVFELERLKIRAAVFAGTGELALNRGLGWIEGTAKPGEWGTTGIAGHRDGFFRGLKDVQAGDEIRLRLPDKTMVYRVSRTEIVNPADVHVLQARSEPALTLVTCYPFYFVGSAPQRFIVHATLRQVRANGPPPADR